MHFAPGGFGRRLGGGAEFQNGGRKLASVKKRFVLNEEDKPGEKLPRENREECMHCFT